MKYQTSSLKMNKANTIFSNAVTFEDAENIRTKRNESLLAEEARKNELILSNLQNIINECRINKSYHYENLIRIGGYNTQLSESLRQMGFTVFRPNPLPGACDWHPDMDDDLYVRDDELYKIQSESKKACILL